MAKISIDNTTYAHLQPQALEVERAVLGALMNDRDAYAVVCEILSPESFYEQRNQLIYSAIRDLSIAEKPIDVLTVTDELERQGSLDKVGGAIYIADLSNKVASSANITAGLLTRARAMATRCICPLDIWLLLWSRRSPSPTAFRASMAAARRCLAE